MTLITNTDALSEPKPAVSPWDNPGEIDILLLWLRDYVNALRPYPPMVDIVARFDRIADALSRRSLDTADGVEADAVLPLVRKHFTDTRHRVFFHDASGTHVSADMLAFCRELVASRPSRNAEPVAWEGYWPGAGSVDSQTILTRFRSTMEKWEKDGAEITPLFASPPAQEAVTDAARDVLAERRRQVEAEGWTPEHDDAHDNGELSAAAGVYALAAASHDYRWVLRGSPVNDYLAAVFKLWPFEWSWFKPKSRRQDKVKAAALLLADIEREDRALHPSSKRG